MNPLNKAEDGRAAAEWDVELARQVEHRLEQEHTRDDLRSTDPESVATIAEARDRIASELDAEHYHDAHAVTHHPRADQHADTTAPGGDLAAAVDNDGEVPGPRSADASLESARAAIRLLQSIRGELNAGYHEHEDPSTAVAAEHGTDEARQDYMADW
jgi:hypothetical protein